MSLAATVIHNPGITYSNNRLNGFIDLLVVVEITKDIREIINRTADNKYVFGRFITNEDVLQPPNLKHNNIDFVIHFKELKENIDVSGKLSIFTCSLKESIMFYNNLSGDFTLGINIALDGSLYRYDSAPDQIKERGSLHSVFINWQK